MNLNRVAFVGALCGLLCLSLAASSQESKPRAGLKVWDTGASAAEPLATAAIAARRGWTEIPADQAPGAFKGDAVVSTGRVTAVLRKQGAGAEVYSQGGEGATLRARLLLQAAVGDSAARLERLSVSENGKGSVSLDVSFKTSKGSAVAARLRFKKSDISVEVEPQAGAQRLRLETAGQLIVLPDFFADDILVDARRIPLASTELPTDNFFLHLAGKGDAIVMGVFENREQDVRVTLEGEREKKAFTGSEIVFGKGKKVWVGVVEAPGIWHAREIKKEDAGNALALDWKAPFAAQWRTDFTGSTDLIDSLGRVALTDSWEMLLEEKGGTYLKPAWLGSQEERLERDRNRMGQPYPCWTDLQGQGYFQPLNSGPRRFVGPAVVYAINRVKETPPDAYTVVDVVRNSLGVGPCEYLLDLEGQKQEKKGHATCGVRWFLEEYYGKREQKQRRAEIDKILDDGLAFVTHIRARIVGYLELGRKTREYLAQQAKAHPELKEPLDELDKIAHEVEMRVADREAKMKTPAFVAGLNADFRKNVLDYDGPDVMDRVKKYCEALVEIGENQDSLVMVCRWVTKSLRQRAGMMMITNPKLAPIAEKIRAKTQEVLRNPATYEKARN